MGFFIYRQRERFARRFRKPFDEPFFGREVRTSDPLAYVSESEISERQSEGRRKPNPPRRGKGACQIPLCGSRIAYDVGKPEEVDGIVSRNGERLPFVHGGFRNRSRIGRRIVNGPTAVLQNLHPRVGLFPADDPRIGKPRVFSGIVPVYHRCRITEMPHRHREHGSEILAMAALFPVQERFEVFRRILDGIPETRTVADVFGEFYGV